MTYPRSHSGLEIHYKEGFSMNQTVVGSMRKDMHGLWSPTNLGSNIRLATDQLCDQLCDLDLKQVEL